MSWGRAVVSGVLIVAVAFFLLVYVPDLLLSDLTGLNRHGRVLVATAFFTLALVALAWGLRKLQRRDVV